ncbi:MAG: LruC domain-containing protein [Roseateles sp.]
MKRWMLSFVLALLAAGVAFTQSLSSLRLTDTVDKGMGDINLFKNLSAAQLEAFRSANGGLLVFGVDINEAANGTEKASSQGVSVADAWLDVTLADGSTRSYGRAGNFWTETQALVAPTGSTTRAPYYSLLGESGSSRITASNNIQAVFDSTLKIRVPDSLSGAVAAVLRIRLLDTNTRLGDPEAFYDFTAGFEDLAILAPTDAQYLDTTLASTATFRSEAPAMELSPEGEQTLISSQSSPPPSTSLSWQQQPAAGGYELAAYEDLAPQRGDYDFNDLVVAYRYQLGLNANGLVERIEGTAYLIARGSTYRHDWTLDLPLPAGATGQASCSTVDATSAPLSCSISAANGLLRWQAFGDTVAAFPAPGGTAASPINTPQGNGFSRGPKASFSVIFSTPIVAPAAGGADPWLLVRGGGQIIRLSDRGNDGYPYALKLPQDWAFPIERNDMGLAYPALAEFISSSGSRASNWHLQPSTALVRSWSVNEWAW